MVLWSNLSRGVELSHRDAHRNNSTIHLVSERSDELLHTTKVDAILPFPVVSIVDGSLSLFRLCMPSCLFSFLLSQSMSL